MERLNKVNMMPYLVQLLATTNDVNWVIIMLELLTDIFKRHRLSEGTIKEGIDAVESITKRTWDVNVKKHTEYFFEVLKLGPRPNLHREWMTPNPENADTLFQLNLPELLLRNEGAEKFPENNLPDPAVAIDKNTTQNIVELIKVQISIAKPLEA